MGDGQHTIGELITITKAYEIDQESVIEYIEQQ
jgi:hypothetical protein